MTNDDAKAAVPSESGGDTVLIDTILIDARDEAEKIRSEAQASVAQKRAALEEKLAQIDAEVAQRIESERERLRRRTDAAIALAQGRAQLRLENRVYELANAGVVQAMSAMRGEPSYRDVVREWIVEGALGLGADVALVRSSAEDATIVAAVIDEARREIAETRGRNVDLKLNDEPAGGQGVVLRDPDARLSYTNTVADRMRRFSGAIQREVYHTVIEGIHGRTDHR